MNIPKKLNVTSKERMIADLNLLVLHLLQSCHTFETKYRPMQTHIRVRLINPQKTLSDRFLFLGNRRNISISSSRLSRA